MVYRVHMAADMAGSPIRGMAVRMRGVTTASKDRQWARALMANFQIHYPNLVMKITIFKPPLRKSKT